MACLLKPGEQITEGALQERYKKPETLRSATAFLAASKELRLAIVRTAGNFRLVRTLAQLLDESERVLHLGYLHLDLTKLLSKQHEALLGAVRKGDGEAAEALSVRHIADTKRMLLDALLSSASFLAINLHNPSDAGMPAPGEPAPRRRGT